MKKHLVKVLVLVVLQMSLWAEASLKANMQAIGATIQVLGRQFRDSSKNGDSARLASQLQELFTATLSDVPETLLNLPPDQKEVALAQYKTLIQQEIDLSVQLQLAFEANDNARAGEILRQMLDIQSQGHGAFKP